MKIRRITSRLWRLDNGESTKDVWLLRGVILPPKNKYNVLTEEEEAFVEAELKKEK